MEVGDKLELIDVFNNNGASKDFSEQVCFEDEEFFGTPVSFRNPVHIEGRAENIGGRVEITAHVTGSIKTVCARCLKDVVKDVDFDFVEHIVNAAGPTEDDDVICLDGSDVDIGELALSNFLTTSPLRYLCSEDCKGLCPKCGADRNLTCCGCDDEPTDPRLDVLNNLFK